MQTTRKGTDNQPYCVKLFRHIFPRYFYGNAVLASCALILVATTPGQSFFLGLYTEMFIHEFEISRTTMSGIFAAAFICSAVFAQVIGKIIDRFGSTTSIILSSFPFMVGMMLTATASNSHAVAAGFILTRVFGTDGISLAVKVAINRWFRKRRGRAMAVVSFTSAVEILLAGGFNILTEAVGWRLATGIASAVCLSLIIVGLQFFFDLPERLGLLPDNDQFPASPDPPTVRAHDDPGETGEDSVIKIPQKEEPETEEEINFTMSQALRTNASWAVLSMLGIVCVGWGGLNVHMRDVCAERGLPPTTISLIYTAIGICSPVSALAMGWAIDRARTKQAKIRVMAGTPLACAASILVAVWMSDIWTALLFGVATGLFVGFFDVTLGTALACLYGRKHLGSIQALAVGCVVLGVAGGPIVLSASIDAGAGGGYAVPLLVMAAVALVSALTLVICRVPAAPAAAAAAVVPAAAPPSIFARMAGRGHGTGAAAAAAAAGQDEGQAGLRANDALAED